MSQDQDPDYHINPNYQNVPVLPKVRPSTAHTGASNTKNLNISNRPPTAIPATPRMLRNTSGNLLGSNTPQRSNSTQRAPDDQTPLPGQAPVQVPLPNDLNYNYARNSPSTGSPNSHQTAVQQLPPLDTKPIDDSRTPTPTRLLPPVSVDQQQQQFQAQQAAQNQRHAQAAQPAQPASNPKSHQRTSSVNRTPSQNHHHNHHHHQQQQQQQQQPEQQSAKRPNQSQFHRRSIGDWDFMKTIGAGSMGKVKLARHRKTNEVCAIKIIPRAAKLYAREHAKDPPPIDQKELEKRQKDYEKELARDRRTIREASLGKILYHPFICRLFEVITMSNHYYMLFEYVSGGQMLDYIVSHGSLKERQARKFVRGIASALDYLHRNNVVHRDLKIENIMISNTGDIKIIDFGLSNFYSNDALLKTYCGSLYFAAPELLSAHPYIGPEVDVWSFGVVLYVLVCGKVPFDDQDVSVLHEKIKKGKVEYPDHLSKEVVSLLSRMLVVNPNKRAGLAEVMTHPWIVKGYEGSPTSFVPHRIPLPIQLDLSTISEMTKLEFGKNEEQITRDLNYIISSKLYQDASDNWNKVQRSDSSVPKGQIDPTTGFHPLVSIYYLVDEMLKRKKAKQTILDVPKPVKEQPREDTPEAAAVAIAAQNANSQQTSEAAIPIPKPKEETPKQAPVITFPEAAHTSPRTTSPPPFPEKPQISTSQAVGNEEFILSAQQKQHPQSAQEDGGKGFNSILRRFSQKRSHSTRRPPPSDHPLPSNNDNSHPAGFNGDNITRLDSKYLMSPQQDALVRRVGSMKLTRKSPFDNDSPPSNEPKIQTGNTLNVPKSGNKQHNRTVSEHTGAINTNSQQKDESGASINNATLKHSNAPVKKYHPSARAKSVGHASRREPPAYRDDVNRHEGDALPPLPTDLNDDAFFDDVTIDDYSSTGDKTALAASNNSSNYQGHDRLSDIPTLELNESQILTQASKAPEGTMPSIEYPRSLFLKGFFSVQTTSTKPLPVIRYNIILALTKLGVKYTEVRGGFICVHTPSIEQPSIVVNAPAPGNDNSTEEEGNSLRSAKSSSGSTSTHYVHETRTQPLERNNTNEGDESFDQQSTPSSKNVHRRKFSIGGSILGSYRRKNGANTPAIPPTPVATSKYESNHMTASPSANSHAQSSINNDFDSSASLESLNAAGQGGSDMLISSRIEQGKARTTSTSGGQSGQVFTNIANDANAVERQNASNKARTPLKFEIHVVKVPLVGLSGVHFKKVLGNTWMYKALAGQILNDLNL